MPRFSVLLQTLLAQARHRTHSNPKSKERPPQLIEGEYGTQECENHSIEKMEESLMALAIESWRFSRVFNRMVSKLDAKDANRYTSQLRYFQKRIDESLSVIDLRLVNLEGQPFDPGIAASALNLGDFEPDDNLLVDQMVEPIIMGSEGLKKQGTLMLRKVAA